MISIEIQMAVIIGIPALLIYTYTVFCFGYSQGHKAGFDIAMRISAIDKEGENNEIHLDNNACGH